MVCRLWTPQPPPALMFHGIKLPLSQTSACLPDLFTVCLTLFPITEGLNLIWSVIFIYIDALTWDGTALSQLHWEVLAKFCAYLGVFTGLSEGRRFQLYLFNKKLNPPREKAEEKTRDRKFPLQFISLRPSGPHNGFSRGIQCTAKRN